MQARQEDSNKSESAAAAVASVAAATVLPPISAAASFASVVMNATMTGKICYLLSRLLIIIFLVLFANK